MANEIMSVEGQLVGMPLAGPESFSQQQLDYLARALGVDETVLWDGTVSKIGDTATVSESLYNFDKVIVYASDMNNAMTFCTTISNEADLWTVISIHETYLHSGGTIYFRGLNCTYNDATRTVSAARTYSYTMSGNAITGFTSSNTSGTSTHVKIYKIVGIHRIAGGN